MAVVPMNVFIRALTGQVYNPVNPPEKPNGEIGLIAHIPIMRQVVLGYIIQVTRF